MFACLAVIAGFASFAGAAAPGQAAEPDPLIVNAKEYPWSAIGRVNTGGRGFCTGFMVAPQVMLTAAHCLYDFREQRWWPTSEVHFLPGYQRDTYLGHARVLAYSVAGTYQPRIEPQIESVLDDWAVVILKAPIGETVGWLGIQRLDNEILDSIAEGRAIALQAGYRRDRPHAISVQVKCSIPGLFGNGRGILHSCDVNEGGSGSPLLVFANGDVRALGIHAVRARIQNGAPVAGALATSVFDPDRGSLPAVSAWRDAGLSWGRGRAPESSDTALRSPTNTIDLLLGRLGYSVPINGHGLADDDRRSAILAFERSTGQPETGAPSLALLGQLIRALN